MHSWKILSPTSELERQIPHLRELALRAQEALLRKVADLPLDYFLILAEEILANRETHLIPTLIQLCLQKPEQPVVELLEGHLQDPGAPLVRNYCNLALAKIERKGPYREYLKEWALRLRKHHLLEFREQLSWSETMDEGPLSLTPQDKSQLLVDSVEALASFSDQEGIETLIGLMRDTHPLNRLPLAGLLLRATN